MSGKKSFLVYYDSPAFKMLDDSQLGRLVRMMLAFDARGEEPTKLDDARLEAVWIVTRGQLERDAERYESRCAVNRANGRKGGLAKATNRKRSPQSLANLADTDTDTDTEIDTEIDRNHKEGAETAPVRPYPTSVEEVIAWAESQGDELNAVLSGYQCEDFFNANSRRGWVLPDGTRIRDWHAMLRAFAAKVEADAQGGA